MALMQIMSYENTIAAWWVNLMSFSVVVSHNGVIWLHNVAGCRKNS